VVKHIPFLQQNWPHQPLRITANAHTIPHITAGVKNIHSFGLAAEVVVVLDDVWGTPAELSRSLQLYETQLAELLEYFGEHPELPVPGLLNRPLQGMLNRQEPDKPHCGAGTYMQCYTPEGAAYPCHRFTPLCSTRPSISPSAELPSPAVSPCASCSTAMICPTCQGANWESHGSTAWRTTFHCEFFKREAVASARLLMRRIQQRIDHSASPKEDLKQLAPHILGIANLIRENPLSSTY
jgi:uncharacterized protein